MQRTTKKYTIWTDAQLLVTVGRGQIGYRKGVDYE